MCINIRRQFNRRMPHEVLCGSDIHTFFAQIRAVSVPETIGDKIIRQRVRRYQLIPVYFAAHRDVHCSSQRLDRPLETVFGMLVSGIIGSDIGKLRRVLDHFVEFWRNGDITVRVLCLGAPDVQHRIGSAAITDLYDIFSHRFFCFGRPAAAVIHQ